MKLAEKEMEDDDLTSLTNTQRILSHSISQNEAIALSSRTPPSSTVPEIWENEINSSVMFGPSLQHNPWDIQPGPLNTSLSSTQPSQGFINLSSIGLQNDTKQFSTSDDIANVGNMDDLYCDFQRGKGLELDNQLFPIKQNFQSYSDMLSTSRDTDKSTLPAFNQTGSADGGNIIEKNILSLELLSQLRQGQLMPNIGNTCYPASSQTMNSSSTFQAPLRSNLSAPLKPSLPNSEVQYETYKNPITTATPAQKEQTGMDCINTASFAPSYVAITELHYLAS